MYNLRVSPLPAPTFSENFWVQNCYVVPIFFFSTSQVINTENVQIWWRAPVQIENGAHWTMGCGTGFIYFSGFPIHLINFLSLLHKRPLLSPFQQITEVPPNCVIPQVAGSKYCSYVAVTCLPIWILRAPLFQPLPNEAADQIKA
jgi:hypothetical protein